VSRSCLFNHTRTKVLTIFVENTWDVAPKDTDYKVGSQWWTDSYASADYWHNCAGARNQLIVRDEIMEDWGQRWLWLRECFFLVFFVYSDIILKFATRKIK